MHLLPVNHLNLLGAEGAAVLIFNRIIAQSNNGSCLLYKCKVSFWAHGGMYLQHSMGFEAACRETVLPLGWLMWTRNTSLTRVFLRPMSVSPLRSSMSELRSFRIPAQSILQQRQDKYYIEVYRSIGVFLQIRANAETLLLFCWVVEFTFGKKETNFGS